MVKTEEEITIAFVKNVIERISKKDEVKELIYEFFEDRFSIELNLPTVYPAQSPANHVNGIWGQYIVHQGNQISSVFRILNFYFDYFQDTLWNKL